MYEFLFEPREYETKIGKITIRHRDYADEEDIIRILESYGRLHPDSYRSLYGFFIYEFRFLAIYDREKVGLVEFERIDSTHGHIGYVLVVPEYRGNGIGTALVKHALYILKRFGIKHVRAVTEYYNEPSIRMLKRAGFEEVDPKFILERFGKETYERLMRRFVFIETTDIVLHRELRFLGCVLEALIGKKGGKIEGDSLLVRRKGVVMFIY